MTDQTNNRFASMISFLSAFEADEQDVTPVKFSALSGTVHEIECQLQDRIVANIDGLDDVKVTLMTRHQRGDIRTATQFTNGGRVRVIQNGWRPGRGNTATPEVQIIGAKLTDLQALAVALVEAIIILRGLVSGVKVTDARGRTRPETHWAAPCAILGVEYKALDRGEKDAFGRQFGTFGDASRAIERLELTIPGDLRAFLPTGATWKSEVKRIIGNRTAKSEEQLFVNCVCPDCAKSLPGDAKEQIKLATRRISIALLNLDPMAGACTHKITFRVVEGDKGMKAEPIALADALAERAAQEDAAA